MDDYGHHPTEIEATLKAAKQLDYDRVVCVFQPFTYSRTSMLLNDFARVLDIADEVILSEIMGSREVNTYNIYSKDLQKLISKPCVVIKDFNDIKTKLLIIKKEEIQFKNEISKLMTYLNKSSVDIEKQLYIDKIKELEDKLKLLEKNKEQEIFDYLSSNISDKDIIKLELETGNPICYELDENLKPIRHYYLK